MRQQHMNKATLTKKNRLRICDTALLAVTVLALASSIQLEATGSSVSTWVWVHIAVCTAFIALICRHIYLHFKWNWRRLFSPKKVIIKALSVLGLLVVLSASVAAVHWIATENHSGIGGIHGKLGFLFLIIATAHIVRHRKFYR